MIDFFAILRVSHSSGCYIFEVCRSRDDADLTVIREYGKHPEVFDEIVVIHPPVSVDGKEKNYFAGDEFVAFLDTTASGMILYGPFPNEDCAEDFGERHRGDGEYKVMCKQD
jgi:hypothetical protein